MALIGKEDVKILDESFAKNGEEPTIKGMPHCVRRFTPSVCDILSRANNPFMTGVRGFESMGISQDDAENCMDPMIANPDESSEERSIKNPRFKPELMLRLNPYIAEAMVLITCDGDTLREIFHDTSLKRLKNLAFEFMEAEDRGPLDIAMMIPFIAERQATIGKANFIIPETGDRKSIIGAKKKQSRRGSHRM